MIYLALAALLAAEPADPAVLDLTVTLMDNGRPDFGVTCYMDRVTYDDQGRLQIVAYGCAADRVFMDGFGGGL